MISTNALKPLKLTFREPVGIMNASQTRMTQRELKTSAVFKHFI